MIVVGLVDVGQRGLEGNTAVYRKEKSFCITISIIHDVSFCDPSFLFHFDDSQNTIQLSPVIFIIIYRVVILCIKNRNNIEVYDFFSYLNTERHSILLIV
jgi:hypothetical protein